MCLASPNFESAGSDSSEGSYEYLVFFSTLVALAKQYDLHPVLDYGTAELQDMFDEVSSCSSMPALMN